MVNVHAIASLLGYPRSISSDSTTQLVVFFVGEQQMAGSMKGIKFGAKNNLALFHLEHNECQNT